MILRAFVKADRKTLREPGAKWLEIHTCLYKGKPLGYYLLYYDDNGQNFADSYHFDLENAKDNAHYACEVRAGDWEVIEE